MRLILSRAVDFQPCFESHQNCHAHTCETNPLSRPAQFAFSPEDGVRRTVMHVPMHMQSIDGAQLRFDPELASQFPGSAVQP